MYLFYLVLVDGEESLDVVNRQIYITRMIDLDFLLVTTSGIQKSPVAKSSLANDKRCTLLIVLLDPICYLILSIFNLWTDPF